MKNLKLQLKEAYKRRLERVQKSISGVDKKLIDLYGRRETTKPFQDLPLFSPVPKQDDAASLDAEINATKTAKVSLERAKEVLLAKKARRMESMADETKPSRIGNLQRELKKSDPNLGLYGGIPFTPKLSTSSIEDTIIDLLGRKRGR
jgi:hypothetical protein